MCARFLIKIGILSPNIHIQKSTHSHLGFTIIFRVLEKGGPSLFSLSPFFIIIKRDDTTLY